MDTEESEESEEEDEDDESGELIGRAMLLRRCPQVLYSEVQRYSYFSLVFTVFCAERILLVHRFLLLIQ